MSAAERAELRPALEALLPEGAVTDSPEALRALNSCTYPVAGGGAVLAARPADAAQVRDIIELARGFSVGVVPVSSGPEHVKGGSVPVGEALAVDLSGMDRVIRVDRRNRVALIEPGVTFSTLLDAAAAEGLRPMLPLLPRSTKSALASYLEREPTLVPKYQWDSTDPLLCVEVVFGTGDVFRTGSAAGPGALEDQWAAGNAQKNPMGPAATDLLKLVQGAQGTMGIVTWATVRLELIPALRRTFLVASSEPGTLLAMARRLCRMKLADEILMLDSVDFSALASCMKGAPDGVRPSPPGYVLVYSIAGYPGYLPDERVAYQVEDAAVIASGLGLEPVDSIAGMRAEGFAGLLSAPCPQPHWKTRPEGACQDLFFLTTTDRVPAFIDSMGRVAERHGLGSGAYGTYVQPILQGRSCHLEFNIFYNPDEESDRDRARALAGEAAGVMAEDGAFFSRPYEPWVGEAYSRCADTVEALRTVKKVFDPAGILNRGKLCFGTGDAAPGSGGGAEDGP